jgi:hypothetical protein
MNNTVANGSVKNGAADVDAVYRLLRDEAATRNIAARLLTQFAELQGRVLTLPVRLAGEDLDAYDVASQLQDLEDAWNNQEPRPYLRLLITPSSVADQ